MQVLMFRNPRKDLGCELQEGQTGEVSDELGAELVKMGIAEEVPMKKIKGVSKIPAISKAESQTTQKGEDLE